MFMFLHQPFPRSATDRTARTAKCNSGNFLCVAWAVFVFNHWSHMVTSHDPNIVFNFSISIHLLAGNLAYNFKEFTSNNWPARYNFSFLLWQSGTRFQNLNQHAPARKAPGRFCVHAQTGSNCKHCKLQITSQKISYFAAFFARCFWVGAKLRPFQSMFDQC